MKNNRSKSLTIPEELLRLENVEVIESVLTSDDEIIIRVKSANNTIPCRHCGDRCDSHGVGAKMKGRHLPILGYETYIDFRPLRGICKKCDDQTTTQILPWHQYNSRYTKPYEAHILLSMVNSTLSDVSIRESISDTAIQNIINRHISTKIDWKKIKRIGIMGIDEISLNKGYQDYVTVVTSRVGNKNKIVAVLKGKEKATIKAFFNSIAKKKRESIVAVCYDMSDSYINAAREVFGEDVAIVVDRFHVAKLYRKALVKLRRKELVRLRRKLSDEAYKSLKKAISILVKKQEKYTKKDKQELEILFKYSPALKAAYRLARQLTAINKINQWVDQVKNKNVTCFDTFIEILRKHQAYITNYFIDRNTSGFVEGLNNKFKAIKRRCYGIMNLKNYFQRIFLDLEAYDIYLNNQTATA